MLTLKHGAELNILRKEIYSIFPILEECFTRYGSRCVITSGTDSHSVNDPHYYGFAIDLRTHDVTGDRSTLATEIQQIIGDNYFVLLEDEGGENEHLHIQVRKDLWRRLL